MWLLLSGRLRRWVLLTVAVPLAAGAANRISDRIERRGTTTRLSRTLRRAGSLHSRQAR